MKKIFAVAVAALAALAASVTLASPAGALDGPVYSGSTTGTCASIASDPRSVTIIGDSLTVLSLNSIKAEFAAAGRPLCYDAQSGRRSDQAIAVVTNLRDTQQLGATVILALGTNDVGLSNPYLNQTYQQLLGATYPRPTTFGIGWRGTDPTNAARVQMLMTEWDNSIGRVYSVRWGDIVKAHPEYIGPDGIHPNTAGQVAYAQFLLGAAQKATPSAVAAARLRR